MEQVAVQPIRLAGREPRERPTATGLLSVAVGLVVWELLGRFAGWTFLPPLSEVIAAWREIYRTGALLAELAASLRSLAFGYGAAAALGVLTGVLMARYARLAYFLDPFVDINLSTPNLIYVPVLFALFGIGDETRYIIVFLYAYFIIVVNTRAGFQAAAPDLDEMAYSFGASEAEIYRRIRLPAALPLTMAGLRLGISRGVKGMVNGEMFIALVGLGARLRYYGGAFDIPKVLALLMTIIIIAMLLTAAVQRLDRRLTFWAEMER